MRILLCSTKEVFRPMDGRCSTIHGRLELLAGNGHEVHLALFDPGPYDPAAPPGAPGVVSHRLPHKVQVLPTALRMVLGGLPFQVAQFRSSGMKRKFRALVEQISPDVIITDMLRTYPLAESYLGMPGGPKVVLDLDDLLHRRYLRSTRGPSTNPLANTRRNLFSRLLSLPALARLGYYWEGVTLRRYTYSAVRRADHAILVSPKEVEILDAEAKGHCPVTALPNFVSVDAKGNSPATSLEPKSIGIMGNFKVAHNLALAAFFIERIFPLIQAEEPEASLHLLGSNPPPALQEAARANPNIRISGYIPDLKQAMARMALASCYMNFGTGIKTKILEFMALGVPVAASTVGMEGIPGIPGRDCVIEDDVAAYARACVRLLRDADERARMGEAGKALVARTFSREAVGQKLEALLKSLFPGHGDPGS
jgi:glycosyltransferase involved in cell wall biosynthesis